jgi:O-acetyl-ADP-ribose deacetylase (regulator of RNase III)
VTGATSRTFGAGRIELIRGDITQESTDAIVNAANSSLLGGGGVDGAIHRAGGPAILEECRAIRAARGSLPAGEAVITTAGRLPSRHVIHTVGPVWNGGGSGEPDTLARCYRKSLALGTAHGLASIAFPSISTGAFGYPVVQAARIALSAVRDVLEASPTLTLVRFVLFSAADLETYSRALKAL